MSSTYHSNGCPSIYQGIFANPILAEQVILVSYTFIFFVGFVGNIMTIFIFIYHVHLRTPTNYYLLNLAVSDLMMLMCNLPLEMLEIHNREWPLSVVFCKLRNICAEFFTCSSILTILAFTCERYFAIVQPTNPHRLSHFRRAKNIIFIIWLISIGFSISLGLPYEIEVSLFVESNQVLNTSSINNNNNNNSVVNLIRQSDYINKIASKGCKSCAPKKSVEKILSIIIIITSVCFFYFPMIIIGAIYLFIGKALHHANKTDGYSNRIEISISSLSNNGINLRKVIDHNSVPSGLSNRDVLDRSLQNVYLNPYSWVKRRARCQARKVVVKTLVAVVIAFFVCYAPLYLQRLLLAIVNLCSNSNPDSSFFSYFMAYLYVISGITFYFGSVINPILYNVISNKYRRAFSSLFRCCLSHRKQTTTTNTQQMIPPNHSVKRPKTHYIQKYKFNSNSQMSKTSD